MNHIDGKIHIYYGDGKGKTTAAMGLALRALGRGMLVAGIQFLKNGDSGEILALRNFERASFHSPNIRKFLFEMNQRELEQTTSSQLQLFDRVTSQPNFALNNVFVLDEVLGAIEMNTFPLQKLLDFLKTRPRHMEVIITGRVAPETLLEVADYVTMMCAKKHPYSQGVSARMGIEM